MYLQAIYRIKAYFNVDASRHARSVAVLAVLGGQKSGQLSKWRATYGPAYHHFYTCYILVFFSLHSVYSTSSEWTYIGLLG